MKFLYLAENMIQLSGEIDIEIIRIGQKSAKNIERNEEMDMMDNELIFFESDKEIKQTKFNDRIEN